MSNKVIPKSKLRIDNRRSPAKQPAKLSERTYCRECNHRKRGNTWELDYCRWFKKLCKEARMGGNMAILKCKGYGEIQ